MKFVQKIIDLVVKFTTNQMDEEKLTLLLIGGCGLIVLVFLISLVGILLGGGKFNSIAAKAVKCLEKGDTDSFKAAMEKLPKAQKTAWESYKKTRIGAPSASFPPATCLNGAFDASLAKAATPLVGICSVLATVAVALLCAVGYNGIGILDVFPLSVIFIVATVGALFTLLTFIFARLKYAAAVKHYSEFCAVIDAKYTKHDGAQAQAHSHAHAHVHVQEEAEEEPVVVANESSYQEPEVEDNYEDSEPVVMTPPPVVEPVVMTPPPVVEPVVMTPPPAAEPIVMTPPPPVRPEPIVMTPPPAAEPIIMTPPPAAAPAQEEEDICVRIDRMIAEGASIAQIKEVAKLLQIERAKPENRSPEQARRLNDALGKLVKAMSGAK